MSVSVEDVAINAGRLPESITELQQQQIQRWIDYAEATIAHRMGDLDALDQDVLAMVITEAVSARFVQPEKLTQVDVRVDDASYSKRYQESSGLVEILPEWWALLGWVDPASRRSFSIRPHYTPDGGHCAW